MTLISIIFFLTKPNKAFQTFKLRRDGVAGVGDGGRQRTVLKSKLCECEGGLLCDEHPTQNSASPGQGHLGLPSSRRAGSRILGMMHAADLDPSFGLFTTTLSELLLV